MISDYLKIKIQAKETKISILLLLLYSSIAFFNPNILAMTAWGENPPFYLANYAGFFFWFAALFFILPVYAVYLQPDRRYFENLNVIYRLRSRRKYWFIRVKIAFLESGLYVVFLYLLMLIRAGYFHQLYHYLENWSFFLKSFFLQSLAFTLFAVIFALFSMAFDRAILGFACAYLLFAYDFIASNVGLPMIYFIYSISMTPEKESGYWSLFLTDSVLIAAFVLLGLVLLDWKDYLRKAV